MLSVLQTSNFGQKLVKLGQISDLQKLANFQSVRNISYTEEPSPQNQPHKDTRLHGNKEYKRGRSKPDELKTDFEGKFMPTALCSRNFQNVKLRLDFFEI